MITKFMVISEDAEQHVEAGIVYFGHCRENAERVFAEWKETSTAHVALCQTSKDPSGQEAWETVAEANN